MQRSAIAFTGYLSLVFAFLGACGPEPVEVPDSETPPNTGGTGLTGQGGATGGTGGAVGGTGGAVGGTGGAVGGTGGALGGTGGALGGTGGATGGVGGATAGTGSATGGVGGATAGTGGSVGGAAGGGAGTGAAGAAPVACDTAFAVGADGFVRAPAAGGGCWHGYASAGGDMGSTVMPTSFGSCGAGCMLRFSGTVGPATEANMYAGVVYMGFNLNQPTGSNTKGTVTPTGTGLAVQHTNTGASTIVRIQISSGATRWCAPLTSASATIPYAMFNTQCWEGGAGTAYAKEPIDTVQLVIPGGTAAAPFDVTLVSVQDM